MHSSNDPPQIENVMKPVFRPMLVAFIFIATMLSCNNEDLFVEPAADTTVGATTPTDSTNTDGTTPPEDTDNATASTTPCNFTLDGVQSGDTVVIDCFLDLQGQTVTLPPYVTIVYAGGDIINGTLNFSDNSVISGELLNASVTLSGSKPQMKDTTFQFDPQRWGIVEGKVTDEVALNNKEILQTIINQTKDLGITTFRIDVMDAYFKVDLNSNSRDKNARASIQIPSDFELEMSDNTFVRVQPNGSAFYTLMTTYLTDNSIISGGHLVGDRFEHNYAPVIDEVGENRDTHEYGHLLWIIGSHNVEVENVNLSKATGDGIVFHAKTLRNIDGTLSSDNREVNNALIKNCTISECRRNGISFLDGRNITIDNCIIKDTGKGDQAYDGSGNKIASSAGTAPKYGIDLEAIRTRNADGSLNETAIIENITIRNSTLTGNEAGDIVLFTANDVIVENNYFDKWVSNFASNNVAIQNNMFESRDPSFFAVGIQSFLDPFGEELNHHYQISNNTIKNYGVGIRVAGKDQTITNNLIENCQTGVFLIGNLFDSTFSGNTITSSLDVSFGYKNFYGCQNMNNINITGETISVKNRPISLIHLLDESTLNATQITFNNCDFNTTNTGFKLHLNYVKNIKFDNNTSNTDFEVLNSENIIITNNLIGN